MALVEWVTGCRQHSKRKQLTYCYVQIDGEHISQRACTCRDELAADCLIDYHRHLYVQRHPMFATAIERKAMASVRPKKVRVRRAANR